MSTEENGIATGSTERANDESTEFDQNSSKFQETFSFASSSIIIFYFQIDLDIVQ